jgi:hypothetical protein
VHDFCTVGAEGLSVVVERIGNGSALYRNRAGIPPQAVRLAKSRLGRSVRMISPKAVWGAISEFATIHPLAQAPLRQSLPVNQRNSG